MEVMDFFNHYKCYHFFSICFGMGCGLIFYRPYYSMMGPLLFGVLSTVGFEFLGAFCDLSAHAREGRPYHWKNVTWGLSVALFVAVLHREDYHVYTLSVGWGIIVFAITGAKREYSAL